MGKSSKDKRDVYYRIAKENNLRARSAFKLMQIDEEFDLFKGVCNVVDLCAAPGSWTQVVLQRIGMNESKIVAVDLQAMAPLEGVVHIQGDITEQETVCTIISHFQGASADIVLSDGAPDVTGVADFDEYAQEQLLLSALNISTNILKPGGTFLAKIFRGKDIPLTVSQMQAFFKEVTVVKPRTSRNSSHECFVLCRNFFLPSGFKPSMKWLLLNLSEFSGSNLDPVKFKVCGSEKYYDPDTTYPLQLNEEDDYEYRKPTEMPILPPYAKSISLKQEGKLLRN